MEKSIIMYNTRLTGEITSISYSLLHGIGVGLKGFAFNLYFIRPEELHFGGKNCELSQLVVGSKIEFNSNINPKTRNLYKVKILSDGIREVDTDGNFIK